jgi:hypothetical protein
MAPTKKLIFLIHIKVSRALGYLAYFGERRGVDHDRNHARASNASSRNDGTPWNRARRWSFSAIEFAVCDSLSAM